VCVVFIFMETVEMTLNYRPVYKLQGACKGVSPKVTSPVTQRKHVRESDVSQALCNIKLHGRGNVQGIYSQQENRDSSGSICRNEMVNLLQHLVEFG
jgi:hypothetical protein